MKAFFKHLILGIAMLLLALAAFAIGASLSGEDKAQNTQLVKEAVAYRAQIRLLTREKLIYKAAAFQYINILWREPYTVTNEKFKFLALVCHGRYSTYGQLVRASKPPQPNDNGRMFVYDSAECNLQKLLTEHRQDSLTINPK